MATVAECLVKVLAAAGVKRIYGIVGDSLNGIVDALSRENSIQWIHVRHEEVAAFAAGADAHVTGELAVCAGSCGPGNLHLIKFAGVKNPSFSVLRGDSNRFCSTRFPSLHGGFASVKRSNAIARATP